MRATSHRLQSILFGISVLSWSLLAWRGAAGEPDVVRLGAVALHLVVGLLLLVRRPPRLEGTTRQRILSVPAIVIAGVVVTLASTPATWSQAVRATFVLGAAFAALSLFSLGRNFAVLPALRNVVVRGPYRLVRHPAYLGEGLMLMACCTTMPPYVGPPVGMIVVALLIIRIRAEEEALRTTPEYRRYCERVPYRLVPRLW